MRPRMAEAHGQCRLRIKMLVSVDQRRLTAERTASVGADCERRGERAVLFQRDRDAVGLDRHAKCLVLDDREVGQRPRVLRQRLDQNAVLDVPAKRFKADFLGIEFHLRCTPEPAGVVDDAQIAQRLRSLAAQVPHAEGFECGYGTRE